MFSVTMGQSGKALRIMGFGLFLRGRRGLEPEEPKNTGRGRGFS